MSDTYPGDRDYTRIIDDMRGRVAADRISMQYWQGGAALSRSQVCQLLADRHNNGRNAGQGQTSAAFLGLSVTSGDCLNALSLTRGYPPAAGLTAWAGHYQGTWYAERQQFTDNALWHPPRGEPTRHPRTDRDSANRPRFYSLQPVEFLNRSGPARFGWNQSHPELPYIWGWDPKEGPDERGQNGAHLGYPFQVGAASCII